MLYVKNLRNKESFEITEDNLKVLIIEKTHGKFIDAEVKQERTFYRGSAIKKYLLDNYLDNYEGVYLITANSYINNNPDTRHILISTKDYNDISNYINPNIPIYFIENIDSKSEFDFSRWFRKNLGKGFCITDIDHFLVNGDVCFVLEEKNFRPKNSPKQSIPFSQKLSNTELIEEVLSPDNINVFMYCFNASKENELFVQNDFDTNYVVNKKKIGTFVQSVLEENFTYVLNQTQSTY